MKILMLTPYLPYPLLSGGQIRSYNLLKNLSRKHDITLFSFIRKNEEKAHLPELQKFCRKVVVFKRRPAWDIRNLIISGLTAYPFLVAIYISHTLRTQVTKELQENDYDLIHAETFYVMPNIPKTNIPTLLVEQTIEYLGYQTFARQSRLFPIKPLLLFDVAKIKFWEKYYWKQASRLVTMSKEDKEFIQNQGARPLKIDVVANGVDIEFFERNARQKPEAPIVLFVGNFKWLPNKDAALFLARDIWPRIRKLKPNARLWIVGANPTQEILNLQKSPGVTVLGDVPDIRDVFSKASVMLSPVRNGRGTRYKILESMAAEVPVVATRLSVEGIAIKPGVHALVSDEAETLAQNTVEVLESPSLQKTLSQNGKKLVAENYNWQKISKKLDSIYLKLGKS